MRRVVISCGPIPARVDSVKFITNRFKGGLAFGTAEYLIQNSNLDVTIIAWKMTEIPENIQKVLAWEKRVHLHTVLDVYEYYTWFETHAKEYDAFVMGAAVANLAPVNPYEGKFPSHKYQVGEKFSISFTIAPRAIDIIKKVNPRACLIGYKLFDAQTDEELVNVARHTLTDSKANIIFANTPKEAKSRKIALTQDGAVMLMTYDEHNEMILSAVNQTYFHTDVVPLTTEEQNDVNIRRAKAIVEMFEETFWEYGTVAVPVMGHKSMFVTTARGHNGEPVIIRNVDRETKTVYASGKATLNAPALWAMMTAFENKCLVIHRHEQETLDHSKDLKEKILETETYKFPGTIEEYDLVTVACKKGFQAIKIKHHGYLAVRPISSVDWNQYYDQFPVRYFQQRPELEDIIRSFDNQETLEIGGNVTATGTYSYDPFVTSETAKNITLKELEGREFSLGFARNSINYLSKEELQIIISQCAHFVANTFRIPPEKKVTSNEAVIKADQTGLMLHALRLKDDSLVLHHFYGYTEADYMELGLQVLPYGKNSALVVKNMENWIADNSAEVNLYRIEQQPDGGKRTLKALINSQSIVEPLNIISQSLRTDKERMVLSYVEKDSDKVRVLEYRKDDTGQIKQTASYIK